MGGFCNKNPGSERPTARAAHAHPAALFPHCPHPPIPLTPLCASLGVPLSAIKISPKISCGYLGGVLACYAHNGYLGGVLVATPAGTI